MPPRTIRTASDFFNKYAYPNQLKSYWPIAMNWKGIAGEEVAADYFSLSYADRYIVFTALQKQGYKNILHHLTRGRFDHDPNVIFDNLQAQFTEGEFEGDVWNGRLAIVAGMFAAGEALYAQEEKSVQESDTASTLAHLRRDLFAKACDLYLNSGKQYWDTDGDFEYNLIYETVTENAFDDQDTQPLDASAGIRDDDHDFVDRYEGDPDDSNPDIWLSLEKGSEVIGESFDLEHLLDGTKRITVRIHLMVAEEVKDKEKIAALLTDEYKKKLEEDYENFYKTHRESKAKDIDLDIQFLSGELSYVYRSNEEATQGAHFVVEITDHALLRSNSLKWNLEDLNKPAVIVHEIMHLFKEPDRYYEEYVDQGARDRLFSPGFVMLEPGNIMHYIGDGSIISVAQMRKVVSRLKRCSPYYGRRPAVSDYLRKSKKEPNHVDRLWSIAMQRKQAFQQRRISEELNMNIPMLYARDITNPSLQHANKLIGEGKKEESLPYLHNAWSSELSNDEKTWLAFLFFQAGKKEWALDVRHEAIYSGLDAPRNWIWLGIFYFLAGQPEEAIPALQIALSEVERPGSTYGEEEDYYFASLYQSLALHEVGKSKEAWEVYQTAVARLRSYDNKFVNLLNEWTVSYFIQKRKFEQAEKFWVRNNTDKNEDQESFVRMLSNHGYLAEARQYREKYFGEGWSTYYVALLMSLGELQQAVSVLEEAVAKDLYNLELRYWLAMIRLEAGDVEKAVADFREIVRLSTALFNEYQLEDEREAILQKIEEQSLQHPTLTALVTELRDSSESAVE